MNFWQENKPFVVAAGVAVIALFFLWPSLLDLGPTVVSLDRTAYDRTELERRKLKSSLDKYYPTTGKVITVKAALNDIQDANKLLLSNFEEMHRWMSFVQRFPFRVPESRKESERPAYVSLAWTYFQSGELINSKERVEVHERYDGVNFAAGIRGIKLGDPSFGLRDMALPESIKNPDTCIIQIGLLHDLGQLAIRLGVDEILSASPGEPYTWAVKGTNVAKAFPINLRIGSDLPTLISLLHALDGTHGRVVDVGGTAEEPAPAAPKPRPAAGEEPKAEPKAEAKEEPKEERPAPDPKDPAGPRIVIQVQGNPSFYTPTAEQAGLKERLTLFRPTESDSHELEFVANAIITRSLGEGKIEAIIEPFSDLKFSPDGKTSRNRVLKGDFASSRFFLIRSIKVKVADAKVEKDRDGFPTDVVPAHLETDLSVAALQFLKVEAPKVTVEAKPVVEQRPAPKHKRL